MKVSLFDRLIRIKLNTLPYDRADLSNAYQNRLNMSEKGGRYNIGAQLKKLKAAEAVNNDEEVHDDNDDSESENEYTLEEVFELI